MGIVRFRFTDLVSDRKLVGSWQLPGIFQMMMTDLVFFNEEESGKKEGAGNRVLSNYIYG